MADDGDKRLLQRLFLAIARQVADAGDDVGHLPVGVQQRGIRDAQAERVALGGACLLYTSDAADERSSVDLGGRRIIKKKKKLATERGRRLKTKE